jgi:hypothetical protein
VSFDRDPTSARRRQPEIAPTVTRDALALGCAIDKPLCNVIPAGDCAARRHERAAFGE